MWAAAEAPFNIETKRAAVAMIPVNFILIVVVVVIAFCFFVIVDFVRGWI